MRESNLFSRSIGFLCILITLGLNSNAAGQPQRRALPDSNQIAVIVDTLAAKLQLSDSVKSKIKTIYIASFADLKKEQDKSRGDFRAMRNSRRDITEKREKDIKTLLNGRIRILNSPYCSFCSVVRRFEICSTCFLWLSFLALKESLRFSCP